jgi:hypothetical protein
MITRARTATFFEIGTLHRRAIEGPHYGSIFGTITVALIGGGATGPWMAGVVTGAVRGPPGSFAIVARSRKSRHHGQTAEPSLA